MKQDNINLNRRNMLKKSILGLTAITATSMLGTNVYADGLPDLTEEDPMAMGLGYKKDTATVDAAKQPKHAADQSCAKCALFTATTDGVGTCTIFAGKQVSAKGWCTAWAKKA